jgi:hypothetical protein
MIGFSLHLKTADKTLEPRDGRFLARAGTPFKILIGVPGFGPGASAHVKVDGKDVTPGGFTLQPDDFPPFADTVPGTFTFELGEHTIDVTITALTGHAELHAKFVGIQDF